MDLVQTVGLALAWEPIVVVAVSLAMDELMRFNILVVAVAAEMTIIFLVLSIVKVIIMVERM